jgi:hypothetical protein
VKHSFLKNACLQHGFMEMQLVSIQVERGSGLSDLKMLGDVIAEHFIIR